MTLSALFLALVAVASHRVFAASPSDAAPQEEAPTPPLRNGNVWAGRDHQPSRVGTESAEELNHETTPRVERRYDDDVSQIQRQLERTEQRYPPGFLEQQQK